MLDLINLIKSFLPAKKESTLKQDTIQTAVYHTAVTAVDNRPNTRELIKNFNPYHPGNLKCDTCGENVSKIYTTTTPKNCLTQYTRVVCEYCFCTQPRKQVAIIEGELYNSLRAKYNLGRKYFPVLKGF